MKRIALFILALTFTLPFGMHAQLLKNLENKATTITSNQKGLSTDDVANGLKEALKVGIQNGATRVGAVDGYFKNPAIKIPMPPEAQNVETKVRQMGGGEKVDQAILSMNRAAENAAVKSIPIFTDAITHMSFSDAMGILKGGNSAATDYLKRTTSPALIAAFTPIIKKALEDVNATKYWGDVFNEYNKIPFIKHVNPDLTAYVTQKAIDGLFVQIALEEAKIRTDPGAQVTDILKKVFGQ